MDNTKKKPYYKPNTFSGLISENIDTFITKYNRAASINRWSDKEKIKFLPLGAHTIWEIIVEKQESLEKYLLGVGIFLS